MKKNKLLSKLIVILSIFVIIILFIIIFSKFKKNENLKMVCEVIYVKIGDIKQLNYELDDDYNYFFKSDNNAIAKIDNQGYIYGISIGETNVNIQIEGKDEIKSCKVKVVKEYSGGDKTNYDEGIDKEQSNTQNPQGTNNNKNKTSNSLPPVNKPTCKLKVTSDGMITSTNNNATKYSFDKNNLSGNIINMHVKDISNKEVKDYEGWKYYRINYYVENDDGLKGSCSLIVIEKCNNSQCTYESY